MDLHHSRLRSSFSKHKHGCLAALDTMPSSSVPETAAIGSGFLHLDGVLTGGISFREVVEITRVAHLTCHRSIIGSPRDQGFTDVVVVPRGARCPRCLAPLHLAIYRLRSGSLELRCGDCLEIQFQGRTLLPSSKPPPPISYTKPLHKSVTQPARNYFVCGKSTSKFVVGLPPRSLWSTSDMN